MAAVRGTPSGVPGSFGNRSTNLRTAASLLLGRDRGVVPQTIPRATTMSTSTAVTTRLRFDFMYDLPLFSVNEEVPVQEALERAADLMMYVEALAAADAFINKSLESAIVQTMSEMAKALVRSTKQDGAEAAS